MNGLILLARGFEDAEALTTRDILIRAGMHIVTASINDERVVTSSHKLEVVSDTLIDSVKAENFDFIVLPGGGVGTKNLDSSNDVANLVLDFVNEGKTICAICAAPTILGHLGLLKGKRYTCYAGCNKGLEGNFTANTVEVDGNIITGRSMKYSSEFSLASGEKFLGKEIRDKLLVQIEGI